MFYVVIDWVFIESCSLSSFPGEEFLVQDLHVHSGYFRPSQQTMEGSIPSFSKESRAPNTNNIIPSMCWQSKRLHEEGAIPITAENFDSIISGIPGLPPIHAMNLPKSMKDPSFYKSMRLNHGRYAKSKVLLCNTFYALEKPVLDAFRNEVLGTDGVEVSVFCHVTFSSLVVPHDRTTQ